VFVTLSCPPTSVAPPGTAVKPLPVALAGTLLDAV
jgi:hypothetical protein